MARCCCSLGQPPAYQKPLGGFLSNPLSCRSCCVVLSTRANAFSGSYVKRYNGPRNLPPTTCVSLPPTLLPFSIPPFPQTPPNPPPHPPANPNHPPPSPKMPDDPIKSWTNHEREFHPLLQAQLPPLRIPRLPPQPPAVRPPHGHGATPKRGFLPRIRPTQHGGACPRRFGSLQRRWVVCPRHGAAVRRHHV